LLFVLQHAAILALMLGVAAAAGTAIAGERMPLAVRAALGLAVAGQLFVLLGTFGVLNRWTICAFALTALFAGAMRMRNIRGASAMLAISPLMVLALYPPLAFDETLYHLPFVRTIAESGAIAFRPELRYPIFSQLHEALCVPAFLLAGDVATHLVATLELMVLAGVLLVWPRTKTRGVLAAALLLGHPIVLHLATITYVDIALTLFVTAGFYCLDRAIADDAPHLLAASAFLLGTACSVKYLGWYFAGAVVLLLLIVRRRSLPLFAATFVAAVLPMYATIIALAANPVFPFFGSSPWALPPTPIATPMRLLLLPWNITFARDLVNQAPPYSPTFALALAITFIAAMRDRRARFLAALCAGYITAFAFLPQDSRYLLPLIPLVSVAAANVLPDSKKLLVALSVLSLTGGAAYAAYRFTRLGPLPTNAAARQQFLRQQIPEYRALEHAQGARLYVCGAEQLKHFGGDSLLGDVAGPWSYNRILGSSADAIALAHALSQHGLRDLLVSKRACAPEWRRLPAAHAFERVYSDDGADLWRVSTAAR
jgi:hypothetical protein